MNPRPGCETSAAGSFCGRRAGGDCPSGLGWRGENRALSWLQPDALHRPAPPPPPANRRTPRRQSNSCLPAATTQAAVSVAGEEHRVADEEPELRAAELGAEQE